MVAYPHKLQVHNFGVFDLLIDAPHLPIAKNIVFGDEYAIKCIKKKHGKVAGAIVDIGAHVGSFSLFAACLFPDARVLAFEAHPQNFEVLKENAAPFPNITCVHAAVHSERGTGYLRDVMDMNTGGNWLEDAHGTEHSPDAIEVPKLNAGDLFKDFGIEEVSILKVDCEGAEYGIFQAMHESDLLRYVVWIRGEWHTASRNAELHRILSYTHAVSFTKNASLGYFIAHRIVVP